MGFVYSRIVKDIKTVTHKYITYYLPFNEKTFNIMGSVENKLHINVKSMIGNSIGKVINSRNMMGLIVFNKFSDNETENMPKKLLLTMRFPSVLQTHNAKTRVDDRLWLTRCDGHVSERETRYLTDVDFYFRENFAQIYHAVMVEWLRFVTSDYIENIVEDFHSENYRYVRATNDENYMFEYADDPETESTTEDLSSDSLYKREKVAAINKLLEAKFEVISLLIPTQKKTCATKKNTCTIWFFFHLLYFVPFIHLVWV